MREVNSGYDHHSSDWNSFLSCWSKGKSRSFSVKNAIVIEKRFGGSLLPQSYADFMAVSGGDFLAVDDAPSYRKASHFANESEINYFHLADKNNYNVWVNDFTKSQTVNDLEYYRYGYGSGQLSTALRFPGFNKLVKVGEFFQGDVLLLNPLEVSEDGEWEAMLLSPQLGGARRYRSFAELIQMIFYEDKNEDSRYAVEPNVLNNSCAKFIKTAANA